LRNQLIKSQNFSRRAFFVAGGKILFLSTLAARMYYLQVLESKKYKLLAEGNRVKIFPVLPSRGKIVDRNGVIIAEGKLKFNIVYDVGYKGDFYKIINKLEEVLNRKIENIDEIYKKIEASKIGDVVNIEKYIEWKDVSKIEVNMPDLPGIRTIADNKRYYEYGSTVGALIGYTAKPSIEDLEDSNMYGKHYTHPDFRIGRVGLEKVLEPKLRGVAGVREVEVNSRGSFVKELDINYGEKGEDVSLTIDIELQKFVMGELSGKGGLISESGSATVLDIKTGSVLAMGSVPSYDNNNFIDGISGKDWQKLLNDIDKPLLNKSISAVYPPGSTFKTVTALAGLQSGLIKPEKTQYCGGYIEYKGRKYHCWQKRGHGRVNMYQALAQSCNVYFYRLAKVMDIDYLADIARTLGLGETTGIEIPGDKPGLIPDRNWKRGALGKPWYTGENLSVSIGQGYTLATPLQLAVLSARLASGRKVVPHIIKDDGPSHLASGQYDPEKYDVVAIDNGQKILLPKKQNQFEMIDIDRGYFRDVQKGMEMVVNSNFGTVYRNRIKDEYLRMAGKTGTAQVLNDKRFKFLPENKFERHHALFLGYAPINDPRYAVSVVIEHGGYGSTVAAPIGAKILLKAQEMGIVD